MARVGGAYELARARLISTPLCSDTLLRFRVSLSPIFRSLIFRKEKKRKKKKEEKNTPLPTWWSTVVLVTANGDFTATNVRFQGERASETQLRARIVVITGNIAASRCKCADH